TTRSVRLRTHLTAKPPAPWPATPSRGGACCATASSCSRTPVSSCPAAPPSRRTAPPSGPPEPPHTGRSPEMTGQPAGDHLAHPGGVLLQVVPLTGEHHQPRRVRRVRHPERVPVAVHHRSEEHTS